MAEEELELWYWTMDKENPEHGQAWMLVKDSTPVLICISYDWATTNCWQPAQGRYLYFPENWTKVPLEDAPCL